MSDAGRPTPLAGRLYLLAEGATVTAGINGTTDPADQAKQIARLLLDACR